MILILSGKQGSGNNITIEGAASLILAQLDKNSWLEKREKIYNG